MIGLAILAGVYLVCACAALRDGGMSPSSPPPVPHVAHGRHRASRVRR